MPIVKIMGRTPWFENGVGKIMLVRRRPNVDWMTQADDRILEALAESNMALSPKVIAYNTGYNREYISQRVGPLLEHELIERPDRGMYRITDRGRAYLRGDLDASDLED